MILSTRTTVSIVANKKDRTRLAVHWRMSNSTLAGNESEGTFYLLGTIIVYFEESDVEICPRSAPKAPIPTAWKNKHARKRRQLHPRSSLVEWLSKAQLRTSSRDSDSEHVFSKHVVEVNTLIAAILI